MELGANQTSMRGEGLVEADMPHHPHSGVDADPAVMLFDEPTSALDPELVGEVLAVMKDLAEEGMTMICVTHEMRFARRVADRVVLIADKGIAEQGPPDQVLDNPQSERAQGFLSEINDH